jgi:hypothetical protein
MIKEQLNVLVNLAASDNQVAEKEARIIHIIGKANGVPKDEVEAMLKSPKPVGDLSSLTHDERFEHLYQLVQLMKVDGQVFKSEVDFCENIAVRLGYKKGIIGELSSRIYSDPSITADRSLLYEKAKKYFK